MSFQGMNTSADMSLKVWNSSTGHLEKNFKGHLAGINDVAWSRDSRYLVTASDDKDLFLWDLCGEDVNIKIMKGHTNYVFCLDYSPRNNIIASGSYDESVRFWDVQNGNCIRALPAHSDPVSTINFSHDASMLASGSYDCIVRLWNVETGNCLRSFKDPDIKSMFLIYKIISYNLESVFDLLVMEDIYLLQLSGLL